MTNDDKELADGLRLLANTARKMSWVGHSPMLAPKVLNKSADRIEALSAENKRLREALGWFLNDSRFVVQVGGNPNVVPQMLAEARARLGYQQ